MKISTVFTAYIIPGVLVLASVVFAEEIQGVPGVDYPNYHSIPQTSFSCSKQKYIPGFYADVETQCQAFHFCIKGRQESFLCPTGTIFNQATMSCDPWFASNCSLAPLLYSVNAGPAIESIGRKIPMLMKLKNRSQGKSMPTPQPNVFEKMSTLYEANADPTSSEELENSSFSEDFNEVSGSNATDDKTSEESTTYSESAEHVKELSEALPEVEQNLQDNDAVEEDKPYEDSEGMTEELEEESDMDSFYDPVTGGYYMDYNPYQADSEDSEPVSDEFKNFYDYENQQDKYEALFQENYDSRKSEVPAEPLPESSDLNEIDRDSTDAEFSRRQLEIERRQRKRPMYFVVEDDEQNASSPSESEENVLGDEPAAQSSVEDTEEVVESFEPPDVSEEVLRELQFPNRREYSTLRPLTTDEFRERIIHELVARDPDELSDEPQNDAEAVTLVPLAQEEAYSRESSDDLLSFQGDDQSSSLQDVTSDGVYESDASAYDFDAEREDAAAYEDADAGDDNEVDEPEDGDADDTLLVIPEESDADVSDPVSNDVDESEGNEYADQNYAYEVDATEQPDVSDQGYGVDEYEDAYEYYNSLRQLPEGYEAAEPSSYEGAQYQYVGPYGRQYLPGQMYGEGEYENVDYNNYSPEEARLAYLSSIRNRDPYSYVQQQYQPDYMDPVYGAGSDYFRDDFSRNHYAVNQQSSNYYASGEAGDYYAQPESPWTQQGASQEYEVENELGVTEAPLPIDITEADLVTDAPLPLDVSEAYLEEADQVLSDGVESAEEEDSGEGRTGGQEDAYYVFDFDEDDGEKASVADDSALSADDDAPLEPGVDDESDDPVLKIDDALLEPDVDDESGLRMDDPFLEPDANGSLDVDGYPEELDVNEILESEGLQTRGESALKENITIYKDDNQLSSESAKSPSEGVQSLEFLDSRKDDAKELDQMEGGAAFDTKPAADTWSPFVTESSWEDKPVTLSSAFERLAALNAAKAPQVSSMNMDYSTDPRFVNSMAFSESMDFGPYGYGTGMAQQFNMMNSMPHSNPVDSFSHRTGGNEQGKIPKLSSIQEKLRSMKQGKFGLFKRYMRSRND